MGRPSLAPGRYVRLLLVGYVEGLDSERAIAWRAADSLSLRSFLRLAPPSAPPDHSTISRTRRLLSVETHAAVFTWVLQQRADAGLVRGRTVGIDATTLEANAALRSIPLLRRANDTIYAAETTPARAELLREISDGQARRRQSRSPRRSFAPSSIGRSFRSGSAHSNTRAPSATTSWLGTMTPTTTAASAISRRPTCITAARRRSSTCVTAPASRPTPRIRSDSSAGHHAQKPCRPPCGSIRHRKRPARMPQDRRPAPRTTRSMRSLPGGDHRSTDRRFNASMAWSRYSKC